MSGNFEWTQNVATLQDWCELFPTQDKQELNICVFTLNVSSVNQVKRQPEVV